MAKVNKGIPKKRGRPATGKDPVVPVRLPVEIIKKVDLWGARQQAKTRSEAIRAMIEVCLGTPVPTTSGQGSHRGRTQSAELAGRAIDEFADQSAAAEDRAQRKRRLVKGPKEFREMRGDLPKPRGRQR